MVVRLVFHDAGTYSAATGDGGLNASIRFELDRPDNFGLKRGWCGAPGMLHTRRHTAALAARGPNTGSRAGGSLGPAAAPAQRWCLPPLLRCRAVIDAAEKRLRGTAAEGAVSKADLIALAGAHAVRITGGPAMQVPVGRVDSPAADPDGRMPELDFSAEQQLANFAAKGLSAQEFIALSGSHTVRWYVGGGQGGRALRGISVGPAQPSARCRPAGLPP